ncbi:hypothetical protein ACFQU2_05535 [Siccirubricoccus deserti]
MPRPDLLPPLLTLAASLVPMGRPATALPRWSRRPGRCSGTCCSPSCLHDANGG